LGKAEKEKVRGKTKKKRGAQCLGGVLKTEGTEGGSMEKTKKKKAKHHQIFVRKERDKGPNKQGKEKKRGNRE